MATTTERPLRYCDVCGGKDDHPRHVQVGEGAGPRIRHLDCCAAHGCAVCAATEQITAGARGADLIEVIAGGALDDFDPSEVED